MKVVIDGVEYVPVLKAAVESAPIKVGSFVRVPKQEADIPFEMVGTYGKVVEPPNYTGRVGVEFAKSFSSGHSLGGKVADKHGYWIFPVYLEVVP